MSPIALRRSCARSRSSRPLALGSKVGARKLRELKENSNYFRDALVGMGLHVYGDHDSPVIPVLLYNPTKIAAFSRECLKRGLAVVTVGFPATPIIKSRARFCVSADKRADLEAAIATIGEVAGSARSFGQEVRPRGPARRARARVHRRREGDDRAPAAHVRGHQGRDHTGTQIHTSSHVSVLEVRRRLQVDRVRRASSRRLHLGRLARQAPCDARQQLSQKLPMSKPRRMSPRGGVPVLFALRFFIF